jgi:tol-pal system protein YbgF
MKTTTLATVAALVLTCLAPGPAAAQNREHQQMAAELRILQEQNRLLALALQETVTQLAAAVKAITDRLDTSDAASRKALADQKLVIDTVNTELRVIRERTQDSGTRIGTLTEEIEAMRGAITALATRPPSVDPMTGLAGDPLQPPTPPLARAGISPSRLYQTAWGDYTAGQYSLAISGFETFLREFPASEQFADDARLNIGNSYLALKRFPEAATAFSSVIQDYPKGDKIPEAYLNLGQAQRSMGQTEAARASWEMVIQNYRTSSSAIIAQQRLDGLPPAPAQQP